MTKSEIFKAAHKLTKEIIKATDSYSATFGLCLTLVYSNENLKSKTMKNLDPSKLAAYILFNDCGSKVVSDEFLQFVKNNMSKLEPYFISENGIKSGNDWDAVFDITDEILDHS